MNPTLLHWPQHAHVFNVQCSFSLYTVVFKMEHVVSLNIKLRVWWRMTRLNHNGDGNNNLQNPPSPCMEDSYRSARLQLRRGDMNCLQLHTAVHRGCNWGDHSFFCWVCYFSIGRWVGFSTCCESSSAYYKWMQCAPIVIFCLPACSESLWTEFFFLTPSADFGTKVLFIWRNGLKTLVKRW